MVWSLLGTSAELQLVRLGAYRKSTLRVIKSLIMLLVSFISFFSGDGMYLIDSLKINSELHYYCSVCATNRSSSNI